MIVGCFVYIYVVSVEASNDKDQRQKILRSVIQNHHVRTQSDLVSLLKKNGLGTVLQSTISRDLLELGVLKKNGAYFLSDDQNVSSDWGELLRKRAKDLKRAGSNMLVLKVEPGAASLIASEIDALDWSELVGTIAGEDTILLIFDTEKDQQKIQMRISKMISNTIKP